MAKKTYKLKSLGRRKYAVASKKLKNTAGKRVSALKTLKQKKRINRFRALSLRQKQRELALRRLRGVKESERGLENANTNENNENNETNTRSLTESEQFERNREEMERQEREAEELERQEELKKYREAKARFDSVKPNTFILRQNKDNLLRPSDLVRSFRLYFYSNSFELFYKGVSEEDSYYYFFEEEEEYNTVEENNDFNFEVEPVSIMVVYKVDPVLFFKEIIPPKFFGWGGQELDFYKSPPGTLEATLTNYQEMREFIMGLPGFREKVRREQEAVFTGPPKLERLRLRGLQEATRQFEERAGSAVPRNVSNTLETYLRSYYPAQHRYLQNRDNLSRISTTLFQ